jgi:hypothetical protein
MRFLRLGGGEPEFLAIFLGENFSHPSVRSKLAGTNKFELLIFRLGED